MNVEREKKIKTFATKWTAAVGSRGRRQAQAAVILLFFFYLIIVAATALPEYK